MTQRMKSMISETKQSKESKARLAFEPVLPAVQIHGSLFSGIGGFELAAQWMGWKNAFHCEIDPFARQILQYYWPKSKSYEDIKQTDFTIWRGKINILTGGFPCQPYSSAGKRKGTEDDRHLWPEMLRAIREIAPGIVVGENVHGLISWNGGVVFEEVQADLEAEGYEVQPLLLPAAGVGAPHRRNRIWFVAYSYGKRNGQEHEFSAGGQVFENGIKRGRITSDTDQLNGNLSGFHSGKLSQQQEAGLREDNVTNTNGRRLEGKQNKAKGKFAVDRSDWSQFPTQPPICSGDDGIPSGLDGITFSSWRNESLKGYGNAIVPQVAYEIFQSIDASLHCR